MFLRRARHWLQFKVEVFVLRGPFYRMLAVIALIGLIAVWSGLFVFFNGEFDDAGDAVWWAFLRLTDPGYLGDDVGTLRRVVSTLITVLGYVVFLGALVAIMTQWFHQTMTRLQEGLTPLVQKQHILVLGWTNRTAVIVRELFQSEERVSNFLARIGARRLSVVLLTEVDTDIVMRHLSNYVGQFWEPARFVLRWGSPMRLNAEHLQRVDFLNASTIILPADESPAIVETTVDGTTIKNLITIADVARSVGKAPPPVVAELLDSRKASLARRAYQGPLQVIASDELISRLLVQNIRHPGLSEVFSRVLGHGGGSGLHVVHLPEFDGSPFRDLAGRFDRAVPIGVSTGDPIDPVRLAPTQHALRAGEKLILLAADFDACRPRRRQPNPVAATPLTVAIPTPPSRQRILILGWNHKAPPLLDQLARDHGEFEIDVLSRVGIEERQSLLERWGYASTEQTVRHFVGDFTSTPDLQRFELGHYATAVILASDWSDDDAGTDARTILGYLVLLEYCERLDPKPHILVELLNPDNTSLFDGKPGEILVSPVLASHVLTQVAMRHELLPAFEELFAQDGAEITFVPLSEHSQSTTRSSFAQLQASWPEERGIVIGLRESTTVHLNPAQDFEVLPQRHEAIALMQRSSSLEPSVAAPRRAGPLAT